MIIIVLKNVFVNEKNMYLENFIGHFVNSNTQINCRYLAK